MAKERLKSPRARLFVALELPPPIREGLGVWQREALVDPALRPLRAETIHVTLAFLGYRPEREVEAIGALIREAQGPAPEARLLPEPLPVPRRRPRLYAIEAESPGMVALAAQVSAKLEAAGFYEPERRPFWPHLTVARVRPERGKRQPRAVERPPGKLSKELSEPFRAVRMTLYRSLLRPSGAEYVPMAGLDLPPADRRERR